MFPYISVTNVSTEGVIKERQHVSIAYGRLGSGYIVQLDDGTGIDHDRK